MTSFLIAFALGASATGALWYFWPTVHADLQAAEKKVGDTIKQDVSKL